MPNHVHAVVTVPEQTRLCDFVQALKGRSARLANEALGRRGRLWQPDYFDRVVRDEAHFVKVATYVEHNPVTARLAVSASGYAFSSAYPANEAKLVAWAEKRRAEADAP